MNLQVFEYQLFTKTTKSVIGLYQFLVNKCKIPWLKFGNFNFYIYICIVNQFPR